MQHNHIGYLPDEKPSIGKALIFALQQFLVMLPATVLAAIIMNSQGEIYSIPAAITASGVATIVFLFVTGFKIPLYYGSSFSYIPAVAIVATYGFDTLGASSQSILGAIIVASIISGLMSIGAGLLIKYFGKDKIDRVLPGHITGTIAMIIGLSLAGVTMNNIIVDPEAVNWLSVLVAMITFSSVAILTVVLKKGFISQIPILLGLAIGVVFSYLIFIPMQGASYSFSNIVDYWTGLRDLETISMWDSMPWFTIPAAFENVNLLGVATLAIFPIAFATIPESAAHVNQIDLYVNELASKRPDAKDYKIREMLDKNLIGDGVGDIVAVVLGGPAGTNYGENISASAVTKNFSSYVFLLSGVLAIALGFILEVLHIGRISDILTQPVIQGVSLYLFGAIAVQGIALMIEKKINIFDPKVLAVMAFISIVGLGVEKVHVTDNFILPGIGIAAFGGILLNLLLEWLSSFKKEPVESTPQAK